MKKKFLSVILFLLCICLCSCGNDSQDYNHSDYFEDVSDSNENNNFSTTRKIIYNVIYDIEEDNINEVINILNNNVKDYNGYVNYSKENDNNAYYIYKIPTSNLDDFMSTIEKYNVENKTITQEDITSSYNSTLARIEVLNAQRDAYLKILTENSLTYSDIITINNEISKIDIELKELELQKESYDESIEYCTVTVYYYTYDNSNFFTDYVSYILTIFKVILTIILYMLPFSLIACLILLIIHIINKNNKKKTKDNLR